MKSRIAVILTLIFAVSTPAHAAVTVTGTHGGKLTIAQSNFKKEMKVKVTGKGFDETFN